MPTSQAASTLGEMRQRFTYFMPSGRGVVLEHIAAEICAIFTGNVIRVAIDGVDGAGKTTFADELADTIENRPIIRASVDSFHNPRATRYRQGKDSPSGFFEDSYNYEQLFGLLLNPLGPGGSGRFRTQAFDHRIDARVESPELYADPKSILLFDGIFLHRAELRDIWDYSIYFDVDFENSIPRCVLRGEGNPDPDAEQHRRYIEGQKIYIRNCQPGKRASIVLDNNDLDAPFIVS